jgi:hypothetical protein
MVEELPSGAVGEMVPVVVIPIGVGMVPNATVGIIAVGDIVVADAVMVAAVPGMDVETVPDTVVDGAGTGVGAMIGDGRGGGPGGCGTGMVEPGKSDVDDVAGCADSVRYGIAGLPGVEEVAGTTGVGVADIDGIVPAAVDGMDVTGTAGVPGVICPVGVEQVTTVPGVVGSDASGTGASVVSGAPGWVVAENGLGPLSGDVTIAPGVDGRPMAVVPMVETCARPALQPINKVVAAMNSTRRIAIAPLAPI